MDIWNGINRDMSASMQNTVEPTTVDPTVTDSGSLENAETAQPSEQASQQEQKQESPSFFEPMPEKFESTEEELSWLRERYGMVQQKLNSDEYYNQIFEKYEEQILKREQEAEEIINTHKALKSNPKEYVRQYFPEALAELGVSPVMSDDEIANKIKTDLAKEFGEDYEQMYNESDMAPWKGKTLSRQIYERGNELHDIYSKQNARSKQIFDDYARKVANGQNPISDEAIKDSIEKQYSEFEKIGVPRAEYDAFVEELKTKDITFLDLWKLRNYEKEIENARKQGIEEGRRGVTSNFTKAAQPASPRQAEPEKRKTEESDFVSRRKSRGEFIVDY